MTNSSFICPSPLVTFTGDGPAYTTTLVAYDNCAIACPNLSFGTSNWENLQKLLCYLIWFSAAVSGVVLYKHLQDFNKFYIRIMFIFGFFVYAFVLSWYAAFNYEDQLTCYSDNRYIESAGMCIFAAAAVIWGFIWINTWSAILSVDTFLHVNLTLKLDSLHEYKRLYTTIGFSVPTIVTLIPLCAGNLGFDPKANVPICFYLLSKTSVYFAYIFMPVYCVTFVISLTFTIACAWRIHTVLISSNHYKSYDMNKSKQIFRRNSLRNSKRDMVVEMSSSELCSEIENGQRNVFDTQSSRPPSTADVNNGRLSELQPRQNSVTVGGSSTRKVVEGGHMLAGGGWKRYGENRVIVDSHVDSDRSSLSSVFTPQYNDPFSNELEAAVKNPLASVAELASGAGSERKLSSVQEDPGEKSTTGRRTGSRDSTSFFSSAASALFGQRTNSNASCSGTSSFASPQIVEENVDAAQPGVVKVLSMNDLSKASASSPEDAAENVGDDAKDSGLTRAESELRPSMSTSKYVLWLKRQFYGDDADLSTQEPDDASRMMTMLGAIWRFNGRSLILIVVYGLINCIGIPLIALSLLVNFNSYVNSQQEFVDCLVTASRTSPDQTQEGVNGYTEFVCGSHPQQRPNIVLMSIAYCLVAIYPVVPFLIFGLNRTTTNLSAHNV